MIKLRQDRRIINIYGVVEQEPRILGTAAVCISGANIARLRNRER